MSFVGVRIVPRTPGQVAYNFFVAPGGGTGAGSFESPWSLAYATGTGGGTAQGDGKLPTTGARIALRGGTSGTQVKYNIATSITHTAHGSLGSGVDNEDGKLIYEGYRSSYYAQPERACLFGQLPVVDHYKIDADYVWFKDLEIARDWANRTTQIFAGVNFWIRDSFNGCKIIQCDSHDGDNGIYAAPNDNTNDSNGRVEIYGNLFRNNGWDVAAGPGGHHMYLHHKGTTQRMLVAENIGGSTFALICQCYDSTANGHVEGIDFVGNVGYNGYTLSSAPWPGQGNNFVLGGEQAHLDIQAQDIFSFWPDGYGDSAIVASWENFSNGVLSVRRAYCLGGGSGYGVLNVRGHFPTRTDFTLRDSLFRPDGTGNRRIVRISDTNPAGWDTGGNLWVRLSTALAWASNTGGAYNHEALNFKNYVNWKTDSGLGVDDIAQTNDPSNTAVFVRPVNRYQLGRGHVIIYNWANLSTIPVNLSPILNIGDLYAVYDNRDPWNPIATGAYAGGTVNFANTQLADPAPIGGSPNTAPDCGGKFNAYVVCKRG